MQTHVQKGHTALHTLYHSSMAQTSESVGAQMSISTYPSEASGDLLRPNGEDNFDFSLVVDMGFACGTLPVIKPRKHTVLQI